MPIRVLSAETARLIAAGEVVTRPLDAARELIDNALDAGASRIEVSMHGGGLKQLCVRDNGAGIPAEELILAALRHATSKLPGGDLQRVDTLGFRGEALWAMSQAGTLTLTTRPAAQLGAARLHADHAQHSLERLSAPAGTTAEVSDLFAHLPARLRTQAHPASEAREVSALVSRYALHYPERHWKLSIDGETRLLHAPSDARGAVADIYGTVVANRLLQVDTPWLSGVISRPELSRPRHDRMFFAVNGRPVEVPPELEQAVIHAYGELLAAGHAPLCVLNLRLPPADINPNIHPAKRAVGLAQLPQLCARVTEALRALLAAQPLARPAPQLRSDAPPDAPGARGPFPDMTLLGVYRQTYLLAEAEGDLWLIDAHAAHERVLYEQLRRQSRELPPLELPEPELMHLSPEQLARLREYAAPLADWGLVIEDFGAGLARLRSLPAGLARLPIARLHEQIVETALSPHASPKEAERAILSRLACAPALKAGMLDVSRAQEVLSALKRTQQPWSCPHGRPTTLRLSERDLAHAFGRRSPRDLPSPRDLRSVLAARESEEEWEAPNLNSH